jgi:hypothetical protein
VGGIEGKEGWGGTRLREVLKQEGKSGMNVIVSI